MAELLAVVVRGARCEAEHEVAGFIGVGQLVCDLKPGHAGPLHYDRTDTIWWSADA